MARRRGSSPSGWWTSPGTNGLINALNSSSTHLHVTSAYWVFQMTSISVQRGRRCKNISVVSTSHIRDLVNVADTFQRKELIALNASLAFPQICDGIENIFINWNRSMAQWWILLLRRGCSGRRWSLKIRLHSQILVLDPFAMLLFSWYFLSAGINPVVVLQYWCEGKMTLKSCTMTGHMELTQISFTWLSGPSFNWKRTLPRVTWRRRWERRSRTTSSEVFVGEFQGKMYALTIFECILEVTNAFIFVRSPGTGTGQH